MPLPENYRELNLNEINLRGEDLRGFDLSGLDLSGADLREAKLQGANFSNSLLNGADLRGANLFGASFTGANLSGSCLTGADLRKTGLRIYQSGRWTGFIQREIIRVGCLAKTPEEWFGVEDQELEEAANNASDAWRHHKAIVQAIHESLMAEPDGEV